MDVESIEKAIASWELQRDELANKFRGVRPGYVSADLALMNERISLYKAKLAEMLKE